jgi:hypothetical protein
MQMDRIAGAIFPQGHPYRDLPQMWRIGMHFPINFRGTTGSTIAP